MKKFTLAILFLSLLLTGCSDKDKKDEENLANEEKQVNIEDKSKIILTTISGNPITLKIKDKGFDFEGIQNKAVMLNFLTTWCPPCQGQIPHLNNLQNRYKDNLVIISVIIEDKKDNNEIINFINENNIEFTVVNSSENFRLANHVGGIQSIPYMILYDKNGEEFKHYSGAIPEEMLEADIKKLYKYIKEV